MSATVKELPHLKASLVEFEGVICPMIEDTVTGAIAIWDKQSRERENMLTIFGFYAKPSDVEEEAA